MHINSYEIDIKKYIIIELIKYLWVLDCSSLNKHTIF